MTIDITEFEDQIGGFEKSRPATNKTPRNDSKRISDKGTRKQIKRERKERQNNNWEMVESMGIV